LTVLHALPDDVDKEWRTFISETHKGQFRKGLLMEELVNAIKCYMATKKSNKYTTTQYTTSTQRITKQEAIEVKNKIIEWMLTPGSNPNRPNTALFVGQGDPRFIVERHLKEAIKIVTGKVDKRTVGNWIRRLEVFECIKWEGPHRYEFLTEGIEKEIQDENKQPTPIPKHANPDAEKEVSDVFKKLGI
jgi:hypothetical protein